MANIIIEDWAGKVLFKGDHNDKDVDKVLDANRCKRKECIPDCDNCDESGYSGDFSVYWVDSELTTNVYEFINY